MNNANKTFQKFPLEMAGGTLEVSPQSGTVINVSGHLTYRGMDLWINMSFSRLIDGTWGRFSYSPFAESRYASSGVMRPGSYNNAPTHTANTVESMVWASVSLWAAQHDDELIEAELIMLRQRLDEQRELTWQLHTLHRRAEADQSRTEQMIRDIEASRYDRKREAEEMAASEG